MAAPLRPLHGLAVRWAEREAGVDFSQAAPEKLLASIRCPVALVQAGSDAFVKPADRDRLTRVLAGRQNDADRQWVCTKANHVECIRQDPMAYLDLLRDFTDGMSRAGDLPAGTCNECG
jgi:hypothetical protein